MIFQLTIHVLPGLFYYRNFESYMISSPFNKTAQGGAVGRHGRKKEMPVPHTSDSCAHTPSPRGTVSTESGFSVHPRAWAHCQKNCKPSHRAPVPRLELTPGPGYTDSQWNREDNSGSGQCAARASEASPPGHRAARALCPVRRPARAGRLTHSLRQAREP